MGAARWWLAGFLLAGSGCARSSDTIKLMAAFSDDTVVGEITTTWDTDGEERVAPGSGTVERRVTFRVDAHNRLAGPLYLRLRDVRLIGPAAPAASGAGAECRLNPGTTTGVLQGAVWVPAAQVQTVRGVQVDHFAIPLSERGRAFYREFLLQQRPGEAAAIDAALATYAAAPRCLPGERINWRAPLPRRRGRAEARPSMAPVVHRHTGSPAHPPTSCSLFFAALPIFVRP